MAYSLTPRVFVIEINPHNVSIKYIHPFMIPVLFLVSPCLLIKSNGFTNTYGRLRCISQDIASLFEYGFWFYHPDHPAVPCLLIKSLKHS